MKYLKSYVTIHMIALTYCGTNFWNPSGVPLTSTYHTYQFSYKFLFLAFVP